MRPMLRPYQQDLVARLRARYVEGRRCVLAVMATGGGKTIVGAEVIAGAVEKGRRVLVLAHRVELIDQMSGKLDLFGIRHGVIKSGHPRIDAAALVQVASVATLARRLDRQDTDPAWRGSRGAAAQFLPDLILVDEAHHTSAGSYLAILSAYPGARVLGLTATPYRLDGKGLGDSYQVIEAGPSIVELVRDGYLVRTRILAPPSPDELARLKIRAGEYSMDAAAKLLDAAAPMDEIVETWQRHAADRLTVAFTCTTAHAQHLAARFQAAGVSAAAIDGDTDTATRDATLVRLARGEIRVLCNCMLLTEGWDLPACASVILARPTQSRALWRQMIGRGMRACEGKTDCLVLDHVGAVHRFGLPEAAEQYSLQSERQAAPPAQQLRQCLSCWAIIEDEAATACHACGVVLPLPKPKAAAQPRDITQSYRERLELRDAKPMTKDDLKRVYWALLDKARGKGYSDGWAAYRYKDRFARFPDRNWAEQYDRQTA